MREKEKEKDTGVWLKEEKTCYLCIINKLTHLFQKRSLKALKLGFLVSKDDLSWWKTAFQRLEISRFWPLSLRFWASLYGQPLTQQNYPNIDLHVRFWEQASSNNWNFPSQNVHCCHILVPGFLLRFFQAIPNFWTDKHHM
jgi:hypothetical protein